MKALNKGTKVAFEHVGQARTGIIRKACHNTLVSWYWVDADRLHDWEHDKDLVFYLSESAIMG